MRILHILATLSPESGGPAFAVLQMAKATARLGHQVTIYTTNFLPPASRDPGRRGVVWDDGVQIRYFPVWRPYFWRPSPAMALALLRNISSFDVVDLHSLYLFHSWVGAAIVRRAGIPYIVRPHGTLDPYILGRKRWRKWFLNRLFQTAVMRRAAAIHFTTEEERRLARPVIRDAASFVVPLGVGEEAFADLPPAELFLSRWPAARGRTILLFLGRLHPKKGIDLLIGAFTRLAAVQPDLHLVIAGPDGGALAAAEAAVANAGLRDRVSFTGMLQGDLKWSAFAAAQLFVLPSHSENFGIAVVEALASGLPVVISDQVNIWPELAGRGVGRVTTCEVAALTAALAGALAEGTTRQNLAAHCRAIAGDLYSWVAIAKRLESMYLSVIANARADRRRPPQSW